MTTQANTTGNGSNENLFTKMTGGGSEGTILSALSKFATEVNKIGSDLNTAMLHEVYVALTMAVGGGALQAFGGIIEAREHAIRGKGSHEEQKIKGRGKAARENNHEQFKRKLQGHNEGAILRDSERNAMSQEIAPADASDGNVRVAFHRNTAPDIDTGPSSSERSDLTKERTFNDRIIKEGTDEKLKGVKGDTKISLGKIAGIKALFAALGQMTGQLVQTETSFANNTQQIESNLEAAARDMLRINPIAVGSAS